MKISQQRSPDQRQKTPRDPQQQNQLTTENTRITSSRSPAPAAAQQKDWKKRHRIEIQKHQHHQQIKLTSSKNTIPQYFARHSCARRNLIFQLGCKCCSYFLYYITKEPFAAQSRSVGNSAQENSNSLQLLSFPPQRCLWSIVCGVWAECKT